MDENQKTCDALCSMLNRLWVPHPADRLKTITFKFPANSPIPKT